MRDFLQRLSSRKFQAALSLIAAGLVMIFSGLGREAAEGQVQIVAGAVMSVASAVTYIWRELKIDLANVESTASAAGGADAADKPQAGAEAADKAE